MPVYLQDLCASFSRDLRAEGKAPRTIVLYGMSVRFFGDWLVAHSRTATLDEFTRPAIREWLADLGERVEPSTVKTRYRGLFRFAGWMVTEDIIESNPMKGMNPPAPPMKKVPVLTDEELLALIKATQGKEFADRRDEAMIRLLLDCGLRVSELCGLTVGGTDLDQGMALVLGKGSKVRPVYFGARTTRAVDRYLRMRAGHRWSHLDALLLTQRGGLSPDGARELLQGRATQAGLGRVHPHMFRHTFAHDFLMAGGRERDLKRLAGWTSDAMLERYGASMADARAKSEAQRMKRGDRV